MLHHAQVGKEVKIIDHRRNVAPDFRRGLRHGVAADLDAVVWPVCTHQTPQQGGFAGAISPRECDRLSTRTSRLNLSKMVFAEGSAQAET